MQFLESMGFMLDNTNFRNLSADAQEQTLRRIPLLHKPQPGTPAGAADAKTTPRQALARLLAGL